MAYIIGIISKYEREQIEKRGWEVEACPAELVPTGMDPGECGMVWVGASVFEVMNGPDWEQGEEEEEAVVK